MSTIKELKETSEIKTEHQEEHEDHRLFGLITFLVADGMTFAGFFAAYLTFKSVNPLLPDAIYELALAEIELCNKVAAKDNLNKLKTDRRYRSNATNYLKNFAYFTKHCKKLIGLVIS